MQWIPEVLKKLRELTGLRLTAARIAAQLGTSKDAVIGAQHRYGIKGPKPPPEPEPQRMEFPRPGQCQWIADNGPWRNRSPLWCSRKVQPGSAYCPEHHTRCYFNSSRSAASYIPPSVPRD